MMLRFESRTAPAPFTAAVWYERRTSRSDTISIADVAAARRASGTTVSVLVPARNQAATIRPIVETLVGSRPAVVDRVIVIDDVTTQVAVRRAGVDIEPLATYLQTTWRRVRDLPVLAPTHVAEVERPPAADKTPDTCVLAERATSRSAL